MTTAAPAVLPNSIVQHLRSARAGARPGDGTIRSLLAGEIFINTTDQVFGLLNGGGLMKTYALGNPAAALTEAGGTFATMALFRDGLGFLSPEMFGAVGDGVTDDSAAVQQAYAVAVAGNRTVFFSKPSYLLATTGQITVHDGVGTFSHASFVGADNGTNLTQLNFANGGGLYAGNGAGFHGLRLSGSSTATLPLIEAKGQLGVYHCRTEGSPYGIQASRRVILGYSSVSINAQTAPNSGLTNGIYSGVAFTGFNTATLSVPANTPSTTATVRVVVSGGTVTSISFDAAGVCNLPCFMLGFAAGALYPGSPAITNAGEAFLSPMGRSRFHELWMIGHKGIAFEYDGGLDFGHANNVHIWDPTGITGGSVAMRIGHADGFGLIGPKFFAYSTNVSWEKPLTGYNSFATVIGQEMDYANVGHVVAGPMKIDMTGGYQQCVGRCVRIASPSAIVKVNSNLLSQADHHISASDFALLNIAGCTFERGAPNAVLYNVVLTASTGKGIFCVGDNTADGNSAFALLSGPVSGTIGINAWPGKMYAATDANGNVTQGYVNMSAASSPNAVNVQESRRTQFSFTVDANGRGVYAHGLGSPGPDVVSVEVNAAAASAGWRVTVYNIDATNIYFQGLNAAGGPLSSGSNVTAFLSY